VLAAPRDELARVRGVGPVLAAALAGAAGTEDGADREAARAMDLGVALVGPGDAGYPLPLLRTFDPPPLLYVRGEWREGDQVAAAVVGARRATPYGVTVAGRLGRGLAAAGVTVVSGLARGVDTAAHRGALDPPAGRTLAVLGSGFARPYPMENRGLLEAVAARGAALSEFPLDTPPLPHNFPRRNRVLAALALGTVVVEAGRKSGSLITARLALELGKEVLAVPGRIDAPLSRGTHSLLRDGAALVEGPEDVLEALGLELGAGGESDAGAAGDRSGGGPSGTILAALEGTDPLDPEEVASRTGLAAEEARARLTDLEIEGRVRAFPGGKFGRV